MVNGTLTIRWNGRANTTVRVSQLANGRTVAELQATIDSAIAAMPDIGKQRGQQLLVKVISVTPLDVRWLYTARTDDPPVNWWEG